MTSKVSVKVTIEGKAEKKQKTQNDLLIINELISILAEFSLNAVNSGSSVGTGEANNFLPWHASPHPSLTAALQMNALPLG